ncbi:hypothetical protein F4679DRAFT_599735 [Xylaria curta]|nr:hypothetical protein F4679DRAFT_599735 [Xylaria curta]
METYEARIVGESLLAMYRTLDGVKSTSNKRPKTWRRADAEKYYKATGPRDITWCHASGRYHMSFRIKAVQIVPFFLGLNFGTEILGSKGNELQTPSNSLLLSTQIGDWFEKYCLVIVPISHDETPITRWKIDLVNNSIADAPYDMDSSGHMSKGKELDGKELKFLSKERPASIFLYYHLIMTLIRIRDIQATGWKEVWARYFTKQPFPMPSDYLRQIMLLAIRRRFRIADVKLIESWIKGEGFDRPITLSGEEATRVARRTQTAMEEVEAEWDGEDSEDDDESEDEYQAYEDSEEEDEDSQW